jgi:hypothetical protein
MHATRPFATLLAAGVFAALAATASARPTIGSGDACTASGGGTSYALRVDVASTDPEQYGFAVGASGARVQSITVSGVEGSFLAQPSPQGATGTWISASRLEPGTVVLTVTTSGPAKSFSLRPASAPDPPAYFDPLACAVKAAPSAPAAGKFTVASRPTYDAASKGWRLAVTLASAGRVRAVQPEPTVGTAAPSSSTAKPLVQSRSVALKSPGRVTLELRPTALGQSKLSATGSLKLKLLVTFFPAGGTAASKVVTLVLKK